jgi:dolichol-phosphate mannosyltransferase
VRARGKVILLLQALFALRSFSRMARTAHGQRIGRSDSDPADNERVTVLVPVLNEANRLGPCLRGLVAQGPDVREILIIDGGSTDGTREIARKWAEQDTRICLIDAVPIPDGVNGKAHGLDIGLRNSSTSSRWVLTMDADVRPEPVLVRSLLAHAASTGVCAFSVATRQELSGAAEGLLHPSMLTTLVYRFGIPGHATTNPHQVQANGQCFIVRREILDAVGGFSEVLNVASEDVTLARAIAMTGNPVGFYESDDLVSVEMYAGAREAWDNWTRSLPMRDQFTTKSSALGLVEATLVQALPLWLAPICSLKLGLSHPAAILNTSLLFARLGVLGGTARAYRNVPWTYWLSPFADIFVLVRIWMMWGRRTHVWRGRVLVTGDPA